MHEYYVCDIDVKMNKMHFDKIYSVHSFIILYQDSVHLCTNHGSARSGDSDACIIESQLPR